jgi:hypothetical protein
MDIENNNKSDPSDGTKERIEEIVQKRIPRVVVNNFVDFVTQLPLVLFFSLFNKKFITLGVGFEKFGDGSVFEMLRCSRVVQSRVLQQSPIDAAYFRS